MQFYKEAFTLAERNYEATPSSTRLCEPLHDKQSSLRRVFVLGHLLVALMTTGSEFPKPANHEIPVVVLVGLPNGGLLEFMNRQPTVRRVVPRYHWHVRPFLSEFFLAPLPCKMAGFASGALEQAKFGVPSMRTVTA